jgi:hypothetical protein
MPNVVVYVYAQLSEEQEEALLSYECSVRAIATYISEGRAHSIVCMCGAGISVSAGIPDFRTPGTGGPWREDFCPRNTCDRPLRESAEV